MFTNLAIINRLEFHRDHQFLTELDLKIPHISQFFHICLGEIVHFSLVQSPPLSDSVGPGASLGAHLASACCHGREGGSCATATEGGGWDDGGPAQLDTQ